METSWQQELEAGQIVLIDGATGTELQRRGVPMDKVAWSGAAVLTHPHAVRETHEVIALEMIVETTHASRALQAALETKLPVWLGVGCKKTADGKIVSFDHTDLELATVLDALIPKGPTVVNIMHSEIGAIPEAIELVRQRWSGPIGVYPESGHFTKPNWNFVDVISPADLVTEALGWVAAGVRLLGGCCGTSPDHIKALQLAMPELEAARGPRMGASSRI